LPHFNLGKSFPNFATVGRWLVTPDEVPDKDDIELGCAVEGEVEQLRRTSDLIIPLSTIIGKFTKTITPVPGDLPNRRSPRCRTLRPRLHDGGWRS